MPQPSAAATAAAVADEDDSAGNAPTAGASDAWDVVTPKKKRQFKTPAATGSTSPAAAVSADCSSFGLWVGNVYSDLVDLKQFHAAFEEYGELCVSSSRHRSEAVVVLPKSSNAFVNFVRLEDACAAMHGLQGKTIARVGPLWINPTDAMQKYLERLEQVPSTDNSHGHASSPTAKPAWPKK